MKISPLYIVIGGLLMSGCQEEWADPITASVTTDQQQYESPAVVTSTLLNTSDER